MVRMSLSEMSLGCEVENLTRRDGDTSATMARSFAKSMSPQRYESTFCPRSVTSL